MFCKYCGKQIAEDSKFCEFCGNLIRKSEDSERVPDIPLSIGEPIIKEADRPAEEPAEEPKAEPAFVPVIEPAAEEEAEPAPEKKKISSALLWSLIGGGVALIVGLIITLILVFRDTPVDVDVTQFADFKVSGYEGYGRAVCEIDWDGLEVAAFGEYPSGSDSKSKQKQVEYKAKVATLKGAIELEFEERNDVSVGDTLVAEFTVNLNVEEELGLRFATKRRVEYTVREQDLDGSSTFELLAGFADVKFEGLSGSATATLIPKEREDAYRITLPGGTEYTVSLDVLDEDTLSVKFYDEMDGSTESVELRYEIDKTTQIVEGDQVVVSLADEAENALVSYGLVIEELSETYTAEGLESLVSQFSEIDATLLAGWKVQCADALQKQVQAKWDAYLHGGNDSGSALKEMENVEAVQSILVLSGTEDVQSNRLYIIYAADVADDMILTANFGLPQKYYFPVQIRDLRLDAEGKLVSDKVVLPALDSDFPGAYTDINELIDAITEDTDAVVKEN